MLFMNEWEIENAVRDYANHPVLGPATRTLANLAGWTNRNSDGWAYWPKPCRAAKRLQELIQGWNPETQRYPNVWDDRDDVTPARYKAALAPIKAFRTRQGADFEIEELAA